MPPSTLWGALSRTDQFPQWWTWLREFDGGPLVEGAAARCVVRAPMPYSLRFTVHVDHVEPERLVDTRVSGDLAGAARLEIEPVGGGLESEARLVWSVEVRDPILRSASLVARPLMEWGHDWVVSAGVMQFRRRALGGDVGAGDLGLSDEEPTDGRP